VKTPGTLLCRQDIELLEKLDANLQLVFPDFSVDEQNSNLLLLQKILRWSGEVGYKSLQIVLLLADNNLDRMEAVHGWFKENNVPLSYTYGVLPKAALQLPDGERLNAYRIFVPQSSGSFAIGYEELQGKLGGHVCWQNQICSMANGDVRPCISAADKVFGNVAHKNILEIIRLSRMDDEVKKTQSGDKRCGKCEFSLGCTTCSITNAKAALADSKTWNCAYSPELGAFL
jgi:radical SAM protein with 4Fe4S-binding SPASM domain